MAERREVPTSLSIPEDPLPVTGEGMSPDCRAGKHGGCAGEGFDDATGEVIDCKCGCTCRACGEHGAIVTVLNEGIPTLVPHRGEWKRGYMVDQGRCEQQIIDEDARRR